MTVAELEKPLSPKEQAEADLRVRIDAFVMPKPQKGSTVLWYPNGSKTDESEVGLVWKVGHRNIVIRLGSGVVRETIRHLNDPKLQLGAGQRENGAWDFTDKDKADIARDQRIESLLARVTELESVFNEPSKKGK